jgi:hypothetical protein
MKRQYLYLSAYRCDHCDGPVVRGSIAVRENEISKETDIREIGAICLSCFHRQNRTTEHALIRYCSPIEWESGRAIDAGDLTTLFAEALNRAEAH